MAREINVLIKIVIDFVLLLVVGIPILVFFLKGNPTKRGFFCDDDSIRYPYKDSTISNNVLYIVGIFLPAVSITLVEFYIDMKKRRVKEPQTFVVLGRQIPSFIWQLYIKIGVFLFGACLSQLTTDIGKYTIGRLRPHFYQICNPAVDCSVGDPHRYIETFNCLREDEEKIREARLSFPSGHSSFSTYTMVYVVLYLQARMNVPSNKLLRPFLQFLFISMAWFTALSRVMDYKHHWSDVLAGCLLGFVVALLVVFFVSDLFAPEKERKNDEEETCSSFHGGNSQVPSYNTINLEQQTRS